MYFEVFSNCCVFSCVHLIYLEYCTRLAPAGITQGGGRSACFISAWLIRRHFTHREYPAYQATQKTKLSTVQYLLEGLHTMYWCVLHPGTFIVVPTHYDWLNILMTACRVGFAAWAARNAIFALRRKWAASLLPADSAFCSRGPKHDDRSE